MDSNKECVVKEYEVHEYVFLKEYKMKKIYVSIYDLNADEGRCTKLFCSKYFKDSVTLINATNEQIIIQVDNMFRNAVEVIDENSFVKKIGNLFR